MIYAPYPPFEAQIERNRENQSLFYRLHPRRPELAVSLSSSFRLRQLLRADKPLPADTKIIRLGVDERSPLLVCDPDLMFQIAKSKQFKAKALHQAQKTILGLESLPSIDRYFEVNPFYLDGCPHQAARKRLIPFYKRAEDHLSKWVDEYAENFLASHQSVMVSDDFAAQFINGLFARLIEELSCVPDVHECVTKALPSDFFCVLPSKAKIMRFEDALSKMYRRFEESPIVRQHPEAADDLMSLVVMGKAIFCSTIVDTLNRLPLTKIKQKDVHDCLDHSTPVSIAPKECLADLQLDEFQLYEGQVVIIALHYVNRALRDRGIQKSVTFGFDAHMCLGKRISLRILQALFSAIEKSPPTHPISPSPLLRDGVLMTL